VKTQLATLFILAAGTGVLAAVPSIDSIELARNQDDLVISWSAPATPVDGYRVYRASDVACTASVLVYEGTATSFTDPGALASSELGLYRIAAFTTVEEGPLSVPTYKFGMLLPPSVPGAVNGVLVSFPYFIEAQNGAEMCADLNRDPEAEAPVNFIAGWCRDTLHTKGCGTSVPCFVCTTAHAYVLWPQQGAGPSEVVVWGLGDPEWRLDFPMVREETDGTWPSPTLYWVTLPYDHDYLDLTEVAADIPGAVVVRVWSPSGPASGKSYDWGVGLSRPSSAEAWTGVNFDLTRRRGEGILVAVDTPSTWMPRRLCGLCEAASPGKPRRTRALHMTRDAADVRAWWPADPRAVSGYDVYRMASKTLIPDALTQPAHLAEASPSPAFPVIDAGAVGDGQPYYYQVVGRGCGGEPGAL
jgi:hypothetical protein